MHPLWDRDTSKIGASIDYDLVINVAGASSKSDNSVKNKHKLDGHLEENVFIY